MRSFGKKILPLVVIAAPAVVSCGGGAPAAERADRVLLWVGDSALQEREILTRIPAGLTSEDSTRLFRSLVDAWIKERLLLKLASENLDDFEEIEKKVADYRNRLIVAQYVGEMTEGRVGEVSEAEVKNYFQRFGAEMVLEQPLVKGVYLKVADNAERLGELKGWAMHPSRESVDRLEKYGLKEAMQYDYFMDRWVDWTQIADQIPYAFGDPDEFLATHRNFETTRDGAVYVLHVAQYLGSGEKMPYSFAQGRIREALLRSRLADFELSLAETLYKKAQASGTLKPGFYDPKTGKMKS